MKLSSKLRAIIPNYSIPGFNTRITFLEQLHAHSVAINNYTNIYTYFQGGGGGGGGAVKYPAYFTGLREWIILFSNCVPE